MNLEATCQPQKLGNKIMAIVVVVLTAAKAHGRKELKKTGRSAVW
jgi:hypothetical protein